VFTIFQFAFTAIAVSGRIPIHVSGRVLYLYMYTNYIINWLGELKNKLDPCPLLNIKVSFMHLRRRPSFGTQ